METSAKTGESVNEIFRAIILAIISKFTAYDNERITLINRSPHLYFSGYGKVGWPKYIPPLEAITRMVGFRLDEVKFSQPPSQEPPKSTCSVQ